jgi:hypothetical protein
LQLSGLELAARFDLLAAVPPVGILVLESILWGGFGLADVGSLLLAFRAYGFTFFLSDAC